MFSTLNLLLPSGRPPAGRSHEKAGDAVDASPAQHIQKKTVPG
jgi:hypothetical protein